MLVAAGWWLQDGFAPPEIAVATATPVPTASAPAVRGRIVVRRVEGLAERGRAGGSWTALASGDELALDELVRTGSGRAVVDFGEVATVEIASNSQVQVGTISERAARMRLDEGHLTAEARGGAEGDVQVSFRNSDAVAVAKSGASLTALSTGDGRVTVASREGPVTVTAKDQSVELATGEGSAVRPGLPPSAPKKVQSSLFLKVTPPAMRLQREKTTVVSGEATPGAVVFVNGVRTVVGEDGRFTANVPLKVGENALAVEVRDVTGKIEKTSMPGITVDPKLLDANAKVEWK